MWKNSFHLRCRYAVNCNTHIWVCASVPMTSLIRPRLLHTKKCSSLSSMLKWVVVEYTFVCFSINRWFKFLRFQVHAKPLSNPDAYSCSSSEIPLSLLILVEWSMAVCDFFWQAPKLKKVEVKKKEVTFLVSINGPFELPKIMVCFLLPSYRKPHHLEPHCMESLPRPCSLEVSAIN